MKRKDLVYAVLAVVILLVAGYLAYTQLVPKKTTGSAGKADEVEVVGVIPPALDESALATVRNTNKVRDFNSPVDLGGLNHTNIFGP